MKKVFAHNIDELFVATSISANFLVVSMLNLDEKSFIPTLVSQWKEQKRHIGRRTDLEEEKNASIYISTILVCWVLQDPSTRIQMMISTLEGSKKE